MTRHHKTYYSFILQLIFEYQPYAWTILGTGNAAIEMDNDLPWSCSSAGLVFQCRCSESLFRVTRFELSSCQPHYTLHTPVLFPSHPNGNRILCCLFIYLGVIWLPTPPIFSPPPQLECELGESRVLVSLL